MGEIITVDGPSASGKSTVGRLLAKKLNYHFLDSGIFYRALTLYLIQHHLDINNEAANARIMKDLNPEFIQENDANFHSPKVDQFVSTVAAQGKVREMIKEKQYEVTKDGDFVIAGRDIGTAIFPWAKLKFYITTSPQERAKRRFKDLSLENPSLAYSDILDQIIKRDQQDSGRTASPARIPQGAVVIDTTNLTVQEVVEKMLGCYHRNSEGISPFS